MKIEFIYWFAYYNLDSPSVRYRAIYPLDFFKENKNVGNYFIVPSYGLKGISFHLKLIVVGVLKLDDLEFIKNYFQDNSNIEIEIPLEIDWNDEVDIQKRIVLFDVGIATLTNSEMQLSKSGIKAKQYMNNGVPVLSTNLPENNAVVLDGVYGYFCDTTNDFKERINQFYKMTDTDYLQFSKNARESISNFDHNKYFTDFEKIKNGI